MLVYYLYYISIATVLYISMCIMSSIATIKEIKTTYNAIHSTLSYNTSQASHIISS